MLLVFLPWLFLALVSDVYRKHPEDYPVHDITDSGDSMTPRNTSVCAVQLQRISDGSLAFQYFDDGAVHFFVNSYLFDGLESTIGKVVWETSPAGELYLLEFSPLPSHPFNSYLREYADSQETSLQGTADPLTDVYYAIKARILLLKMRLTNANTTLRSDGSLLLSSSPRKDSRVPEKYPYSLPYTLKKHIYNCVSMEYKSSTKAKLGRPCMPPEGMRPILKEQHDLFNMLSAGKMYVDYTGSYIYPVCGVTTDEAYTQGNTAPTAYFIKLLDGDSNNRTYPHRAGFIPRVTSRVWVVDYYSDWVGLATVHGVGLLNLNANSYRSGPWAENCYYSLRMVGNPFMHEVGHNGGGLHGNGVSDSANFHRFISHYRQEPISGAGTFSYMASGGFPFLTAVQSASHYYNAWETVLPRWRKVLKHWDNGVIPEANTPGKGRRGPHGGGKADIGMHKLRIMDAEHQYTYKFLGADDDAYTPATYTEYTADPKTGKTSKVVKIAWIGFQDGYDPDDIVQGLLRRNHVLMIEVYLDKEGFFSEMITDFVSVLIEYRSNTRMSWNGHSIHFQALRPHNFESNIVVNILHACVEQNHGGQELTSQATASPIPGRLWTCPECDKGTFQLLVIDGNYARVDPMNTTMFDEARQERIRNIPYRNLVINYRPGTLPAPAPDPRFYPLRFMESPAVHCSVKDGNIPTEPERVFNVTCEALLRLENYAVHAISNYFVNDPHNGPIRQYADRFAYLSTYRTLSSGAINYLGNVNKDPKNAAKMQMQMTRFGGTTSANSCYLHGGILTDGSSLGAKQSDFPTMVRFYDSIISYVPPGSQEQILVSPGPGNFTGRIGWSMSMENRKKFAQSSSNGYAIMFDAVWNPSLYYLTDDYDTAFLGNENHKEAYYLAHTFQYTNGQCGYNAYFHSFTGNTHAGAKMGHGTSVQVFMTSGDRVLMSNLSYSDQTFRLLPDGFSLEGTGCWAHQHRPTIYRANQWHMIYNPAPSKRNWLLVLDFDSEIPDNLILFTDSYNSTDAIDLRMLYLVNKISNTGGANDRTIYWSYALDNYAMLHEYYYRYEELGENPGLRFAFNKDVRLVNIRFMTPQFGTFNPWNGRGKIEGRGKTIQLSSRPADNRPDGVLDKPHMNPYTISISGTRYEFSTKDDTYTVPFPLTVHEGRFSVPAKIEYFHPDRPTCNDGEYAWRLQTGAFTCMICPTGYFCSEGVMNPCPPGYYTDLEGQSSCLSYSAATSNRDFNKITASEYYAGIDYSRFPIRNPDGTVRRFYNCPGNKFTLNGECKTCPSAGYICVPGMDPVLCPRGFRCRGGYAQPCVGDEYQDEEGRDVCKKYPQSGTRLACTKGEVDIPLDGDDRRLRTSIVYSALLVYLMDRPNAGCRPCPLGYSCIDGTVIPCTYDQYSPEGDEVCHGCHYGTIRNVDGSGCVSLDPQDESKVEEGPGFAFYGFYPTYSPPSQEYIKTEKEQVQSRIYLHSGDKIIDVVEGVETVAEARRQMKTRTRAAVGWMFLGLLLWVLLLVGACAIYNHLKKRKMQHLRASYQPTYRND
ncbi:Hypothetical protein DHA2_153245 [Giardia duodenalis]|uniref:Uncharacterized protein n=1 Tax=Giardia intestinalis TaxID=5741 RepID=V6TEM2_GIAIN|nr:Hypothetical protein DHA2_153245 [Giardia intestinalis]